MNFKICLVLVASFTLTGAMAVGESTDGMTLDTWIFSETKSGDLMMGWGESMHTDATPNEGVPVCVKWVSPCPPLSGLSGSSKFAGSVGNWNFSISQKLNGKGWLVMADGPASVVVASQFSEGQIAISHPAENWSIRLKRQMSSTWSGDGCYVEVPCG